jgi:hypothetical protein
MMVEERVHVCTRQHRWSRCSGTIQAPTDAHITPGCYSHSLPIELGDHQEADEGEPLVDQRDLQVGSNMVGAG